MVNKFVVVLVLGPLGVGREWEVNIRIVLFNISEL